MWTASQRMDKNITPSFMCSNAFVQEIHHPNFPPHTAPGGLLKRKHSRASLFVGDSAITCSPLFASVNGDLMILWTAVFNAGLVGNLSITSYQHGPSSSTSSLSSWSSANDCWCCCSLGCCEVSIAAATFCFVLSSSESCGVTSTTAGGDGVAGECFFMNTFYWRYCSRTFGAISVDRRIHMSFLVPCVTDFTPLIIYDNSAKATSGMNFLCFLGRKRLLSIFCFHQGHR